MKMYETRNDAPTPGYQEQSQQKPAVDENNVAEENHEDPAPGTGGHHKNPLARQHVPALTPTLLGSLGQLAILDLIIQARTEAVAERSWIAYRWPHGVRCPRPGCSSDWIRERRGYKRPNALPVTFCCRGCGQPFTVRTYYVMENSPLGFRTWLWATYLVAAAAAHGAAVYPAFLARKLGVTHETAGKILQRIDPYHRYRAAARPARDR